MKHFLIILFAILAVSSNAQKEDTSYFIAKAYQLGWNGNEEEAFSILRNINESDIENLSDTVQYQYYYTSASRIDNEEPENQSKLLDYLNKAIKLREKSLGIQDSEYLELLWAKGNTLEDDNPSEAIKAYQRGVIVGQGIVNKGDKAIDHWFGRLLQDLGGLYEIRGYYDQAISLYNEGFDILSKEYSACEDDYHWMPLFSLETLYYKKGDYQSSVSTCDRLLEFFESKGGNPSPEYATILHFKGCALREAGQLEECSECHKAAMEMVKRYDDPKSLAQYAGELYLSYIQRNEQELAENLEKEIISFHYCKENPEHLVNMFYTASNIRTEANDWKAAEFYLTKSCDYFNGVNEIIPELVYSKIALCKFNQNDLAGAKEYKQMAISASKDKNTEFSNRLDYHYLTSFENPELGIEGYYSVYKEIKDNNLIESAAYVKSLNFISSYYIDNNLNEEGYDFLTHDYDYIISNFGHDHQLGRYFDSSLGVCCLYLGKGEDALKFLSPYKLSLENLDAIETTDYEVALHNVGRAYMLMGDTEKAKEHLLASRDLQLKLNGEVMDKTISYLIELGVE